ncbi:MAG: sulfatase-like hydrolase/transferase [Planctomycetes bacterium]|nr:sulfatase-like hydrolase/transferase [Planctomycetota bacterium]
MGKPLNIVFLMADQWRWDTIFQAGHVCRTPNLLRFAEEGHAFLNAYTCYPLCTPARGSIFTGRWPYQNNLTDNVGRGSFYPHGKLRLDLKTYLERLRDDAGYEVSYCGKWHLGQGTLHERGIHNVRCSDGGDREHGSAARRGPNPTLDGEILQFYYGSYSEGIGLDQCRVEMGIEQIEGLAKGDKPFCAIISTNGPHFPHNIPRRFAEMYADLADDFMPENYCTPFTEPNKPDMQSRPYWPCQETRVLTQEQWRKTCQHYWGFCSHLDKQFGRVLDRLDELGLTHNTVVAFCPDHGEMLGGHGKFDKGPDFYQETMHIPMIIRDPQKRKPTKPDGFVNLRDLFPTLISLAGAEGILNDDECGRSHWVTEHEHTFYCYDSYQGREFKLRGIHTGRYKYNWSPHDLCELYDLASDPGERTNLIDDPAHTTSREELHAKLMAWMESEGDYLLCAGHLPPPGTYIDGRSVEERHDHGAQWPEVSS